MKCEGEWLSDNSEEISLVIGFRNEFIFCELKKWSQLERQ